MPFRFQNVLGVVHDGGISKSLIFNADYRRILRIQIEPRQFSWYGIQQVHLLRNVIGHVLFSGHRDDLLHRLHY